MEKVKAIPQSPVKGDNGGWYSVVYYPISARDGFTVRGKVEWKHREDAEDEAKWRIEEAQRTGAAA